MPTISSGAAAEVTLAAGSALVVSTAGVAIVDRRPWQTGAGSASMTLTNSGQKFGPFDVPAAMRVRAISGDAAYSTETTSPVVAVVVSDAGPVDDDGRPDGTLWLKVTP